MKKTSGYLERMRKIRFWILVIIIVFFSESARSQSLQKTFSPFRYQYVSSFPTKKGEGEAAYGNPRNLAINASREIYVVVSYAKEVRVYNAQGRYISSFGTKMDKDNQKGTFSEPSGITIDDGGLVYISDLARDMVLVFSPDGQFKEEFPIFQPRGEQDACAPFISFNPVKKLLYIPDPCTQRINIYTKAGQFITGFGEMGSNLGDFGGPASCAFNQKGDIYIVDPGHFRIQFFAENHDPIGSFGTKGTKGGEFVRPYSIGIDSAGKVFVSDFVLKSIQVFDHKGIYLGQIKEDVFNQPLGIACSADGHVYVVDGEGQKVHVFKVD